MTGTPSANENGEIDRRTMLKVAGGSAVAAALAGCSRFQSQDDGQSGGQADVPDEPIQAGLQTYTEGPAAVLGLQTQYGAELAIERINEAGGVAGRNIELDVRHESDAWVENYEQYVDEGKDVTFGPTSSGGHKALTQAVEEQGVVNVGTDGTVTTLYEETNEAPKYSFRFQNYDVMEAATIARAVVEEMGADNVNTVAGINPNYAFGKDEMGMFVDSLKQLTDVEVVYEGYPELTQSDMSTHISEVNNAAPDVTFSSTWGGDVTTLMNQAAANDMFSNTRLVGTVLYSAVDDLEKNVVEAANAISGSRNWYWGHPETERWDPGRQLFEDAQDGWDIVPTAHFHSGYGAVAAWATAVEKAIDLIGGWPSQEQIARSLEGHGFYTPAGYHVIRAEDHQGISNSFYGRMEWDDDLGAAVLEDVDSLGPREVAPPPTDTASAWIESW